MMKVGVYELILFTLICCVIPKDESFEHFDNLGLQTLTQDLHDLRPDNLFFDFCIFHIFLNPTLQQDGDLYDVDLYLLTLFFDICLLVDNLE